MLESNYWEVMDNLKSPELGMDLGVNSSVLGKVINLGFFWTSLWPACFM